MAKMTPEIQDATDTLARKFSEETGLEIRVGYIGNLEGYGPNARDYRHWSVWVSNARHMNGNMLSLGDPTEGRLVTEDAFRAALVKALSRGDAYPRPVRDVWGKVVTDQDRSAELIAAVLA